MRIIVNELKKMWRIKILAIIVVLCAAYFITSMNTWIAHYPKGTWFGFVDMAHHLTENYGATLEPEDFDDFLSYRDVIVAELDPFFQANSFLADAGILCYNDLKNFRQEFGERFDTLSDEELRLWWAVSLELGYIVRTEQYGDLTSENETPIAYMQMRSFSNVVGLYHTNIIGEADRSSHIDSFMEWASLSEREYQRLAEIRDSGELLNIMAGDTIQHTLRYTQSLAVLVVLVTLILASPLVTTDRANKVNWLQYSSKQGRKILKKQFIAVLISAISMTTILIFVFAGIFGAFTEIHAFWNNGINSFLSSTFNWLSITFGQYILLMIGIIYLLSISTAVFVFVLSRFSQNMIKLLFKVIPLFVACLLFSNWILTDFLAISIGGNARVKILSLAFSLIVGVVIATFVLHREKRVELT